MSAGEPVLVTMKLVFVVAALVILNYVKSIQTTKQINYEPKFLRQLQTPRRHKRLSGGSAEVIA